MTPAWLPELLARHPACREEDVLKALFQSLYGNGHLLGDAETVRNRIAEETASAGPGRGEPLIEPLGGWIRLNLRPAREAQLPPAWIQAMMSASGPAPADPRDGRLQESVQALDPLPGFSMARLAALADKLDGLPSHSEACRAAERPAYRLLDSAWEPVIPLLCGIARLRSSESPLLITLDGPCGGGKSTLAAALGTVLGCTVLHMDDYVIPHAQKTPERLAQPGGNADAERLCRELLNPCSPDSPAAILPTTAAGTVWRSPAPCTRGRLSCSRAAAAISRSCAKRPPCGSS